MIKRTMHARALLDAWREQGADRFDRTRFHVMEALERRAADHDREARRLLDERLSSLLVAYEVDLENAPRRDQRIDDVSDDAASGRGELAALVDYAAAGDGTSNSPSFAAPDVLKEFRHLWSRLRTDSQMRQSLQQVPSNAGPLNASALVHRAVMLMRDISPGYLRHFLAYVDDLTWLEQINVATPRLDQDVPPATSSRKRAPRKARKQQD
jgi:hypothetical protein